MQYGVIKKGSYYVNCFFYIVELLFGWEEFDDKVFGSYFIDYNIGKSFINIFYFLLIMMFNRVFNDYIMLGYI